jgi:sterol desaturase/sphingolipid hydroxylase (fatty acid hydroxylase superfamily)
MQLSELEKRVEKIEERNKKVELDKKWETSYTRRFLLIVFTYLSIALYMWVIGVENPWLNAVIPSIGFLLSTLTLHFFKRLWITKRK